MVELLQFIFGLLSQWYIWIPVTIVLVIIARRNFKAAEVIAAQDAVLITLEIPRTNDKKELAAEQMFASLHGILRDKKELRMNGGVQEHISFEIAVVEKLIRFYIWVPEHLQNFVEGQIYAQYPTVQIRKAERDYTANASRHPVTYSAELSLTDKEFLPIKTFQSFEVDPLAAITATLAKLNPDEEVWVQILAKPVADSWHQRSSAFAESIRTGHGPVLGEVGRSISRFLGAMFTPPSEEGAAKTAPKELSERDKTRVTEIQAKSIKLGYNVIIRIMYQGQSSHSAKLQMQAIVGAFKQFNSTNLNGFRMHKSTFDEKVVDAFAARAFSHDGFILNIEELASVYHLPHTNVETPNIVWATAKTAEPPTNLPVLTGEASHDNQISAFGLTNFRGIQQQFGLLRSDRSRHMYIIGQTGTGKSGMLELLALSDVFHNEGYAIIDPHGDFAVDNLRFIPQHRIKDVVYFNPADTGFPLGFNPMEVLRPDMKNNISSEIIGVLKRMFGESWGPRLEYILRYTILALLDYPDTTMLDITRMLTDKKFRTKVLAECKDTVVLQFWKVEFASWNDKFAAEAIAPVLNKVGAFTANPIIRNIIGQPKGTFNIRQIMDEGKILIVNLSKGLIGEDNAAILGSFIVTKIQLAAMSRSDIPRVEDRRPFYLYVDEFQNFATDSFATILSEARKYGLNLTVANQYTSQMSDTVRGAVFGNVGTTVSLRVSADDAPALAKQFEPYFEASDLLSMHNRHFVISMVINGEKAQAFSATTLALPQPQTDYIEHIQANTRAMHGRERAVVEREIQELITPPQAAPAGAIPVANHLAAAVTNPGGSPPAVPSAAQNDQILNLHASNDDRPAETPSQKRRRRRQRNKKATTSS